MAKVTTTVSIEADRNYVNSLGLLAKQRKTTIGKLVKDALESVYGSEIAEAQIFFTPLDAHKHETMNSPIDTVASR